MWYLTAQLLELVLPVLIVDKMGVPILGVCLTACFCAVYYMESKRLSAIEQQ